MVKTCIKGKHPQNTMQTHQTRTQEYYVTHNKNIKMDETCHEQAGVEGMSVYDQSGHIWVRMGVGDNVRGSGHGKEARQTTCGHCGSWCAPEHPKDNEQKQIS